MPPPSPSWRDNLQKIRSKLPHHRSEMERILALPVAGRVSPERLDELSRQNLQAHAYEGQCPCKDCEKNPITRLLPDQANGLHSFLTTGRGFWSIKVGGGKTALGQLVATHFHAQHPDQKIMILVQTGVYKQFWLRDLPWARRHLAIAVPWFGLGKRSPKNRSAMAKSGQPGAYVLPYSCLSNTDAEEILGEIEPSLIICDEAQNLSGDSAKTKRFWAYVDRHKPKGIAMSGTLTTRTPMEYHRLMKWCMGENSPLPLRRSEAVEWSNYLKSDAIEFEPQKYLPLLRWAAEEHTTAGFRRAYQKRLHTAPSFYSSGEKELGVSLEIENLNPGKPSIELLHLIKEVDEAALHPTGEILSYGVETHSVMRELSAGFYYRRFWDESHPKVAQAKAHFQAGQEYRQLLNEFFRSTRYPRPGLDTPKLVGLHHANEGEIDGWEDLYDLWEAWKELDDEDLPARESEPVWVDDYKIDHAVAWAKNHDERAIIWVWHKAVGQRLVQRLAKAGIQCWFKGAGDTWLRNDGTELGLVVASIRAHGTGTNLQPFRHQLILQWPRSAKHVEQLIGRTHREGQKADRLVIHTNNALDWDHEQLAATMIDTEYVAQTMGSRPKLLIADWNPLPKKMPEEFLRARRWNV